MKFHTVEKIVGSNPTIDTIIYWGIVKLVRHGILIPIFVGSNPATPTSFTTTQTYYLRPNAVGSGSDFDFLGMGYHS